MPPLDSLLFSANPEMHPLILDDALMCSFRTSPYQATPPTGTWGIAPWGMFYKDSLNQPLSPCIFDYGRAGLKPLYLPDPINNIGTIEYRTLTPSPSEPIQNFGHKDLTKFLEEDLPGAMYPDDDPLHSFKPTIQMVDQYRHDQEYWEQTCCNLGHSS
jgi:hypothetical protein